jgi:hypothetical protein
MNGSEFSTVVDQSLRKRIDNGTTSIILSRAKFGENPTPIVLADGSLGYIFSDNPDSAFHCEWQVWKKSKNGEMTLFLDPEPEPTPADANVGGSNTVSQEEGVEAVATETSTIMEGTEYDDGSASFSPSSGEETAVETSSHVVEVNVATAPGGAPALVERALRSRVAYSERPLKNSSPSAPREDSIRMAPIAICNDRVYCTIDCMKGLKVQALSIICVIRIGNRIFASSHTSFPPPSSLKRKERSRIAKPKRSSPYKKVDMDDEEFDYLDEVAESPEFNSSPSGSINAPFLVPEKAKSTRVRLTSPKTIISKALVSSTPASQFASSVSKQQKTASDTLSSTFKPRKEETNANIANSSWSAPSLASVAPSSLNAPQVTGGVTSFLPCFSPMMAPNDIPTQAQQAHSFGSVPDSRVMGYGVPGNGMVRGMTTGVAGGLAQAGAWPTVLSRLKAVATAYAESVISSIIRVSQLQSTLTSTPQASVLHNLAQWALSGTIALEGKLVSGLLDIFALPAFMGTIDNERAYELLSTHLAPQEQGIFIVRIAQANPRWLEIFGVFRDSGSSSPPTEALSEYCATIIYNQPDPRLPASLWIDTDGNAQDSRSEHISSLSAYITKITGWQPFDRERLQIMPAHISQAFGMVTSNNSFSAPSNPISTHSNYSNNPWFASTPVHPTTPWYDMGSMGDDPFPFQPTNSNNCQPFDNSFVSYQGHPVEK